MTENCPHCDASLLGDPIPEYPHLEDCEEQKDRMERLIGERTCHCKPYGESTHFRCEMGHEIPGVYDGVLFWSCPDCGMAWPRWTGSDRRGTQAAMYVAAHNSVVEQAQTADSP
jgi:hypothetical protein